MNSLMKFENPQFGEIRTVQLEGEPWFVGRDVVRALGYENTRDALARHVDEEDKGASRIPTPSGTQEMVVINESGLYSLILSSKLPSAKAFKRWVTSEVLPSIRKTGGYQGKGDPARPLLAEAQLNNSRARLASLWLQIAKENPVAEYRQICAHYASAQLTGGAAVLPLPQAQEPVYTAGEVGQMLGGVSGYLVGRTANLHGLKTPEYGAQVWDKSPHSAKQVQAWRYNAKAVAKLREILAGERTDR